MNIKSKIVSATRVIVAMVAALLVLSCAASLIPSHSLRHNAKLSMATIEASAQSQPPLGFFLFKLDNFTDALMINEACAVDSDHPVASAMSSVYYNNDDNKVIEATLDFLNGRSDRVEPIEYARYWHGYLVFLRPLLTFIDYQSIRLVNYFLLTLAFVWLLWLVLRRGDKLLAASLMVSAVVFNLWLVPLSMQFSTVFYIALLSSIYMLLRERSRTFRHPSTFFLIVGGLTSYLDLLTTPLVTLGLPLVILLSASVEKPSKKVLLTLYYSLAWLLGYASVWVSKWLLAWALTGYDVADALSSVAFRSSTSYKDFDMSLTGILQYLANYPALCYVLAAVSLSFALLNAAFYKLHAKAFVSNSWLLVVAAMPVAWCLALRNHSVIHCWFVWRVFFVSCAAYLLFAARVLSSRPNASKP